MQLRIFSLVIAFFSPPLAVLLWQGSKPSTQVNLFIWSMGVVIFFKMSFGLGILICLSMLLHSLWMILFDVSNGFLLTEDISQRDRALFLLHLGVVFAVIVAGFVMFQGKVDRKKAENLDVEAIANGKLLFETCELCHSPTRDKSTGLHLSGIVGRKAGIVDNYKYSRSLETAAFTWTEENLVKFLQDPAGFLPGTRMAISPLSGKEASELVAYLKTRR